MLLAGLLFRYTFSCAFPDCAPPSRPSVDRDMFRLFCPNARVVELVDTQDLKS